MIQHARKDPVDADGARALLAEVDHVYVARGKKTVHFDRSADGADDEEILPLVLGRSGTLRAPALRVGTTLVVGYNDDILAERLTPG